MAGRIVIHVSPKQMQPRDASLSPIKSNAEHPLLRPQSPHLINRPSSINELSQCLALQMCELRCPDTLLIIGNNWGTSEARQIQSETYEERYRNPNQAYRKYDACHLQIRS